MVVLSVILSARSFVTTPIFYVNAAPHIGHLYSALLADAAHRWQLISGCGVGVFSTGTDEHGLKVQQAAQRAGLSPQQLCNSVSPKFKRLFDSAGIGYTDYIRTTESRHIRIVQDIWNILMDKQLIYKDSYQGWYSVSDETFLSDTHVTDGPTPGTKVCIETGNMVEWSSEVNYMFKLSAFQQQLLDWVESTTPPVIIPENARHNVLSWLREPLADLSVSRPSSRLSWGVPVPGDNSQTIYVWMDALLNYLTVSGYPDHTHCWPASAHVVGKDILKFHSIYWPAFLMGAGLPPPQQIVCHSHWTMNNTKMSKSKGNVVDPVDLLNNMGVDAVRYFLLKEGSLHQDKDFSEERIVKMFNSDLANNYGNLLQRVTTPNLRPPGMEIKICTDLFSLREGGMGDDAELMRSLRCLPEVVRSCYEEYCFGQGIQAVLSCLQMTNQFIQRHKPWELVSDRTHHRSLGTVLGVVMESLRLCSHLLMPILPQTCSHALDRLGSNPDTTTSTVRG